MATCCSAILFYLGVSEPLRAGAFHRLIKIIFAKYLFCVIAIRSSDHVSRDLGKAYMLAAAHLIAESKISMAKII
ncbi:hypothetical protein CVV38_01205 [Candidatus Peregrinibacteria bacterium HGW-Peregrinibacteria-1]|jgi:hypothetical protein|nr:MAG: hypothetical protein CVV38_01205 [Candidatus Peregrinibacteria bacterium HGW-Peregrinibacteria-1]